MRILHITNGDAAVDLLNAAEIAGDKFAWRDVLHMGPVPMTASLDELSRIRAQYLASLEWGEINSLKKDFANRDRQLQSSCEYDQILLWFEHDLYDQLQLIQILDWFSHFSEPEKISLINPDQYLGYHTPDEAKNLLSTQSSVSASQFNLASRAWQAYRSSELVPWFELMKEDTSELPYLRKAIERSLMELPNVKTGLNATETIIVNLLSKGVHDKASLFRQYCALEPIMFHGDMSFFWYLDQLLNDKPSLVYERDGKFEFTELGAEVLAGKTYWQRRYARPHYIGGYEIQQKNHYCWNSETKLIDKLV